MTTEIIVTSDLHLGVTSYHTLKQFIHRIKSHSDSDCIIVCGDLSDQIHNFDKCIYCLKNNFKTVGIVPGNHDLWYGDSYRLYTEDLPAICKKHKAVWLDTDSIDVGSHLIIGNICWYDYSLYKKLVDPIYQLNDSNIIQYKRDHNNDYHYVKWKHTDITFAKECYDNLKKRIDENQDRELIVATHCPVFEECRTGYEEIKFDMINCCFYYNITIGNMLKQYSNISHVLSGHTHIRCNKMVGYIRSYTNDSCYHNPRFAILNLTDNSIS